MSFLIKLVLSFLIGAGLAWLQKPAPVEFISLAGHIEKVGHMRWQVSYNKETVLNYIEQQQVLIKYLIDN
jgi:hypothetical protein